MHSSNFFQKCSKGNKQGGHHTPGDHKSPECVLGGLNPKGHPVFVQLLFQAPTTTAPTGAPDVRAGAPETTLRRSHSPTRHPIPSSFQKLSASEGLDTGREGGSSCVATSGTCWGGGPLSRQPTLPQETQQEKVPRETSDAPKNALCPWQSRWHCPYPARPEATLCRCLLTRTPTPPPRPRAVSTRQVTEARAGGSEPHGPISGPCAKA